VSPPVLSCRALSTHLVSRPAIPCRLV
jgi:hypothetical protein